MDIRITRTCNGTIELSYGPYYAPISETIPAKNPYSLDADEFTLIAKPSACKLAVLSKWLSTFDKGFGGVIVDNKYSTRMDDCDQNIFELAYLLIQGNTYKAATQMTDADIPSSFANCLNIAQEPLDLAIQNRFACLKTALDVYPAPTQVDQPQ